MTHVYYIILAGGSGTRFWPESRTQKPKQLCSIGEETKAMIAKTLERIPSNTPKEQIYVVTHKDQLDATKKILGDDKVQYIAEPMSKNTGPALALASLEIFEKDPNALIISLHADHLISDLKSFTQSLEDGLKIASKGYLTLLGLTPTHPDTGFGYIEKDAHSSLGEKAYLVKRFQEKPNLELAQKFFQSKNFLWNSGIFIWKASTIMSALTDYMPLETEVLRKAYHSHGAFSKMNPLTLKPYYEQIESLAIDHGVLEKASNIAVIEASFPWIDIGSWDALRKVLVPNAQGNWTQGEVILKDTFHSLVINKNSDQILATIGLENICVVQAGNATLVCPIDRAQEVKKIVEELKNNKTLSKYT